MPKSSGKTIETMHDKNDFFDATTKIIAYVLLGLFALSLIVILYANFPSNRLIYGADDIEFRRGWFDLLKNGLILLGSSLTTIIGYYFGQREGSRKSKEANQIVKEIDENAGKIVSEVFGDRDRNAYKGSIIGGDSPDQEISSTSQKDNDIILAVNS